MDKEKKSDELITVNKALVASEERYRRLFEAAQDGILILNADTGRIEDVNPFMIEMLGYSHSEFLGKELWEIGLFSDINANKEAFLKLKEEGYIRYKDLPLKTKNGLAISVEFVSNRYDVSGGQVIQCNIRNITERKITEENNKRLTERLLLATQSAKLGIWDWDIKNNILKWDEGMYLLYDLAEVEFESVYDGWLSRLHPEDIERVNHSIQQALLGKEDYNPTFRLIWKDSSVHYIEASGLIERDNDGNAIRMIGANWDITERRTNEMALQQSEARLKGIIVSQTNYIIRTDLQGNYTYCNQKFITDFGWLHGDDNAELIGISSMVSIMPYHHQAVKHLVEKCFANPNKVFQIEIDKPAKSKGVKTTFWDFILLTDKEGRPEEIQCVGIDISERKKSEEKIKKSEARLAASQSVAKVGSWETDLTNLDVIWSDEACRIFGVDNCLPHTSHENFLKFVHPDDKEKVVKAFAASLTSVSLTSIEHRIITADGILKEVEERWHIAIDENGKPIRALGTVQDVTIRKKAENKVKESEAKYRAFFENSKDGILLSVTDGEILAANPEACKIFNMTEKEICDAGRFELFDISDPRVENLIKVRQLKGEAQGELTLLSKDGTAFAGEINSVVFTDSYGQERTSMIIRDISERKEAEKSIIREKALSDSIINSLPGIFYLFDETGKFLRWNKEVERVSGYSRKEIARMKPLQFFNDKDEALISEKIVEAFTNGESNTETHFVTKYKKNIPFYFSGKLTTYDDKPCLIGIGVDITERKRTEIKLIELNENLQKQAKELFLSNTELEQFAYVASHDLQEPLRMVTSFLTQLEKKYGNVIDDKGKKYIDFAVDGAKRMRKIILDLLEYSKVGKTEDQLEHFDLNDLLNEIKLLLRKSIEDKKATISIDHLPEINSYRSLLRQVFQNLISNALKYSNKEIPVQINITAKEFNDHWQFAVSDNGIGIEKEYFEKIFILFQRLHNKDEYSGTGIGLTITNKIIGTLGGKIWVESEIGKGSSFYFTLKK